MMKKLHLLKKAFYLLPALFLFGISNELRAGATTWNGSVSNVWTNSSNWTGGVPNNGDDVTINSGAPNYPILTSNTSIKSIIINSGGALYISGNVVLSGSGSFTLNSGGTLGVGSDLGITISGATGNIQLSSTRTYSSGANYVYTGGSQAMGDGLPTTVNNFTTSGTGTKTMIVGRTFTGNVLINSGTTLAFASGATYNFAGDFTNNGNATFTGTTANFTGSGKTIAGATTFNILTFAGGSSVTANNAITTDGALTISGTFSAGSSTHIIRGSWTNNGTFNGTSSTVNFNGSSAQSISGSGTTSFGTLNITNTVGAITANQNFSVATAATVNSGATLNMETAVMSGSGTFTLSSGGNLGIGSANGISSSGSSGNIQVAGLRNFDQGGNYNYNGGAQSLGAGLPATVNNLTFSGTGTKTATASRTINGNLLINSGVTLSLASGATYDLKGNFTNDGSAILTGTTVSFTGSSTQALGGISNTDFGTLRINNTTTINTSFSTTATVGHVYIASGAKMNLSSGTNSAVNGSLYLNNAQQFAGSHGSTTSTATYKNDTYFSLSGLLNVALGAPLPVELVSFTARNVGQTVVLKWSTASELNNEKFIIERSKDGTNFQAIGQELGAGTSTQTNNYTFTDLNPLTGANYYRLKQVDFDGGFEYSHVQTVYFKKIVGSIQVFPTITTGEVQIVLPEDPSEETVLSVYNLQGALLSKQVLDGNGINFTVTLPALPSGQYIVEVKSGALSSKTRIFKG